MIVPPLTTKEQIANTELALKLWTERVKPSDVSKDLNTWWIPESNCGCFGGHMLRWPEFVEKYQLEDHGFGPETKMAGDHEDVCNYLFGNSTLMHSTISMSDFSTSVEQGTDYEIVVNRLTSNLERLRQKLINFPEP